MPSNSETSWNPSAELGSFIASLSYEEIPDAAIETAVDCYTDTVGVTMAGAGDEAGAKAANALTESTSTGPVTIIGHDRSASIPTACFINGTAAHAMDYDDFSYAYPAHPSAVIATVALAIAEARNLTGKEAISAYITGFETYYYITQIIGDSHYETGWHATSTIGTFSATATAAHLLDLPADQTQQALNIAVSHPAGLRCNFGTMSKPMHVGIAARAGATAALLANKDFTAHPNAIAEEHGFLDVYIGSDVSPESRPSLGEDWGLIDVGVGTKKYPSSGPTHSSIAAITTLLSSHNLAPDDISKVTVSVAPFAQDVLIQRPPSTVLEAKFSLEFCIATAIQQGAVGLDSFQPEMVTDPTVAEIANQVNVQIDESLSYNSHKSTVTIDTTTGDTFQETVVHPPGTKENPLSKSDVRRKFMGCADWAGMNSEAADVFSLLNDFPDHPVRKITEQL